MKTIFKNITLTLLAILASSNIVFAETNVLDTDKVLTLIKQRAEIVAARIATVTYRADSRTEVKKREGKRERLVESRRLVTYSPIGSSDTRFLSMHIDGQELDEDEINRELKKSPPQKSTSPFALAEMSAYTFNVLGVEHYQGNAVWEIAFEPKQPAEGKMKGKAFVDQALRDLVWMQFTPSKPHGSVKTMEGEMTFYKHDEIWLPGSLKIQLWIQVNFIFTWVDHVIEIEEKYSEHRIRNVP